jgi:hypothetical protein
MGTMPAESGLPIAVDGEPNPGPPPETVVVAFDRFDDDVAPDAGDLPEKLCDARSLQPSLCAQLDVLEITAAAAACAGMRARRFDPVGRGVEHLDGICTQIRARGGRDPGPHPFARERVADEDHLAVGRSAYAPATPGDSAHLELDEPAARFGRHWRKRTAAIFDKISLSGCRFGAGPIVVGVTTNSNP